MAFFPRPVMMVIFRHSGLNGFFDDVLNQGLVDQRKHFLGLGFGRRKKPGAETGGGKNSFADSHHYLTIVPNRNQRVLVKKCCATER